jgi:biotin carboxylase
MASQLHTVDSASEKPLILLVSSGYHLYREYLLKLIAGSARVWLLLNREPTWEKTYIVGHTLVDTLDSNAMIAAAHALPSLGDLRGVLCWDEVRMVQSAELAQALGLPGGAPDVILRCRDKHQTRVALEAAGVPQPASILVSSLEQARAAAESIGYPVVLKPRALGASIGVSSAESPEELAESFRNARSAFEDGVKYYEEGVLVEEYVEGPEISVDSACVGGLVSPLFLARKVTGFPPHFEEVGHIVDARDPLLADPALRKVLDDAHAAVGFRNGITHVELRLTNSGPKIIEINCRLGGDLIPYVGFVASGIDPGRVAVQVACGLPPSVARTRQQVGAVHFFYPSRDVTVAGVDVDAARLPPSVLTASALAAAGQVLQLPPAGHVTSRFAYAVVVDDTAGGCQTALAAAARAIRLRTSDGWEDVAQVAE